MDQLAALRVAAAAQQRYEESLKQTKIPAIDKMANLQDAARTQYAYESTLPEHEAFLKWASNPLNRPLTREEISQLRMLKRYDPQTYYAITHQGGRRTRRPKRRRKRRRTSRK